MPTPRKTTTRKVAPRTPSKPAGASRAAAPRAAASRDAASRKAAPRAAAPRHTTAADTSAAVDALFKTLKHPHKAHLQALRATVLEASASIAEGVKWNAPSFRTHEYFATVNLREKDGIGVILHLGAKVRGSGVEGVTVSDPAGLLQWLAADRAMVRFSSPQVWEARRAAFGKLVRAWIKHV